jgi:hypothetical protein
VITGPPVGEEEDAVVVDVDVEDPVLLYTLSALGPPQNSELFPLQVISQLEAAIGAPPLTIELPQTTRG